MITITSSGVNESVYRLNVTADEVSRKSRQAIRKALQAAKKTAVQRARARYTAKASILTKSLKIKVSGNSGELVSRGSRNPLQEFKVNPKGRINRRGKYIRAEVVRGQGGVLRLAWRKSSGESIFERKSAMRFPIRKLYSVSAPGMLSVPEVSDRVVEEMRRALEANFN